MSCTKIKKLILPQEYDSVWTKLNQRLHEVEMSGGGLDGVFRELEKNQLVTGFIKDRLEDIERFTYAHTEDESRCLRVQFNPKRALRHRGSGVKTPPPGMARINDGCFLCRENIAWQQQGAEQGYELEAYGGTYNAWMNPFPLLPTHVVIASTDHTTQKVSFFEKGQLDTSTLLHTLVELSGRVPGYVGFYNGVGAGASIPGHLHFHFCRRPEDDPDFPLERAPHEFFQSEGCAGLVADYPMVVTFWRGSPERVLKEAIKWIPYWAERNQKQLKKLTANLIVTTDPVTKDTTLYFAPRELNRVWSGGVSDYIGGLEILGEFVFTVEREREFLKQGIINYSTLEKILLEIHTPLFLE